MKNNQDLSHPKTQTLNASNHDYDFDALSLPVGKLLLDRYEIFAVRQGGMGIVYFVEDVTNQEIFAVKTFPFLPKIDTNTIEQEFLTEIRTWLDIPPHPHIARPLFLEIIDRQPYLFLEYISDGSLRDRIGKLTLQQAISFAYQICLAMEFMMSGDRKIIHADLKPENILITSDGTAKVSDFGTSKPYNLFQGHFSNQTTGSPPYMSPEQLRGEIIDEQSDIFSFGIMFYEMIEGNLPYPFSMPSSGSEQRKLLEDFYANMGRSFFTDNEDWSPWATVLYNSKSITGWVRKIISCSIFPNRRSRWESFAQLRQIFESKFQDMLQIPNPNGLSKTNLRQKALALYRIGQVQEALKVFNDALKERPNDAELWRDAAIALADSNQIEFAKEFTSRALKLNPNIDVSHPKLVELLL